MNDKAIDFDQLAVPGVRALHPYQPGKPESELKREYGLDDIIKLASNENPLGPSPKVCAALQGELAVLARYPDGNGFELKAALADKHRVSSAHITLGNGSNDVLELLARAFLDSRAEAVFSEHAFAVYPLATQASGARARIAKAHSDNHPMAYGHDLDAFKALINKKTRLLFIANPNNPTGTWNTASELEAFLSDLPGHVLAVVDEAYFDYVESDDYASALPWIGRFANLVVTRTFSKAYGLAGLRIGYAVSSPQIADLLNRVRQPFNVNSLALRAALAALADRDYIDHSCAVNRAGLQQLRAGLARMGLRCLPSVANFLCIQLDRPGQEIFESLLRQGIIVRPITNYGLPDFIRVTVGTEPENRRFLEALEPLLKKSKK